MKTTIDRAGRIVIPKSLRDQVGITAGEVVVTTDGAALRIEPVSRDDLVEENGHLIIPASGTPIDAATITALRDADQR